MFVCSPTELSGHQGGHSVRKVIFMKSFRTVVALILSLLLAAGFIGCAKTDDSATRVAATVNGAEILESDVTIRIESFRVDSSTGEMLDDTAWAQRLQGAGYTPETLREFVIRNQFAIFTLILQKASDAGITPDAAQVDQSIADAKASVENSGSTWEDYLKSMGFSSENGYRQRMEAESVAQQLVNSQVGDATPTQAEIEAYVSENAAFYAGKRVSLIYLPFDAPAATTGEENAEETSEAPEATEEGASTTTADVVRPQADEALAKIREGADFSEVAKEYSQLPYVQTDGGDLGWGSEQSLPEDVRAALADLPVNEVSEVLETNLGSDDAPQFAFMIAKWTDEFVIPEDQETQTVEFSTVPADLVELLTESLLEQQKATAQQDYITGLIESDEVVINPMPEGLSYAVDMSLAETAPAEESDEGSDDVSIPDAENTALQPEQAPEPTFDENGLGISDITVGTGPEAKTGDTVLVNYSGYFVGGGRFDSSTYEVTIGQGSVIQGWELGLVGMKVGGKRQLTIPPELAYGETGQGSIPANATLIFDIELLSVNGDTTGAPEAETTSPSDEGSS
jgi:FKBP-type peptidyl-prolyl cis-trans isomerase/parvulin-like peptidyl-prolyl isomerase